MTTNKPKITAWLRNERGEYARGSATFDPLCIFGSPEPQGLVASYSPVVTFTDYEALQAEYEKLRTILAQAREFVFEPDRDCKCQECVDAASLLCAIDEAMQETSHDNQ